MENSQSPRNHQLSYDRELPIIPRALQRPLHAKTLRRRSKCHSCRRVTSCSYAKDREPCYGWPLPQNPPDCLRSCTRHICLVFDSDTIGAVVLEQPLHGWEAIFADKPPPHLRPSPVTRRHTRTSDASLFALLGLQSNFPRTPIIHGSTFKHRCKDRGRCASPLTHHARLPFRSTMQWCRS
jgi:hypothetical protein